MTSLVLPLRALRPIPSAPFPFLPVPVPSPKPSSFRAFPPRPPPLQCTALNLKPETRNLKLEVHAFALH
jgi:hypothetical protein